MHFGQKNISPLHPFCRTVPVISVSKDTIKDDYDMIEDSWGEDMPNKRVYDKLKSSGNSYWNTF